MSNNREKAISGVKWSTIEQIISLSFAFVIGIIIARLIGPSSYGLVAMLGIFIALGDVFVNSGIGIALIRRKDNSQEDYSTAFFINIIIGVLIYLVLFISAPLISTFYNIPQLQDVCRIYSLSLLFSSLSIVQTAKLTHDLQFGKQTLIRIISQIFSGIIAIGLAVAGYGVWALVWYKLSDSIFRSLLLWIVSGWTPILAFSKQTCNYLYSFGSKMLITSIIDVIYDNIYTLLIGKFYTTASVGYYNRSFQISKVPQYFFSKVAGKVFLPTLASYQDDKVKMLDIYERMTRIAVFCIYPIMILLIVLSRPLIIVLLGNEWIKSILLLQLLSLSGIFYTLTLINLNLFFVKGRSDILLKADIQKKAIGFILVVTMVHLGLVWVCIASILYSLTAFMINCNQTKKIINYGLIPQVKQALPSLIYSILAGMIVSLIVYVIESDIVQLLVGGIVGIISYIGIAALFREPSLVELKRIIQHQNGK